MSSSMSTRTYPFLNACIAALHHSEEDGAKIDCHLMSILGQSVHLVHRLSANFDIFEWQSHIFQK